MGEPCSNPQCFKEKNYVVKFSTSQYLKKLAKIILKQKKETKKKRNQFWVKIKAYPRDAAGHFFLHKKY